MVKTFKYIGTAWVILMLAYMPAYSQIFVGPTMTGTPAAGAYYNNTGITLTPPFNFTAAAGQNLRIYISAECAPLTTNGSQNRNYIITSTPRAEDMVTLADLQSRNNCELMQTVQYFDGLGKPLQTIQVQGSPNGKDIVQSNAYDQFDREPLKYLSYAASGGDGSFKADALTTGITSFYNPAGTPATQTQLADGVAHITSPFAGTVFEPSPLNRVTEQGAPGDAWQPNTSNADLSHTNRVAYGTNDVTAIGTIASTLKVMLYKVNIATDGTRTLANAGTTAYVAGQLYVTINKDENWQAADLRAGTVQEFKNKDGQVILKRAFNRKPDNNIEMLSTYYVYDDFGLLCYVLPPGALPDGGAISQTMLDNLCYQYQYDKRKRLIEKKLPGKGKEFMVYNALDQVVATQDAIQRGKSPQEWSFTKYDAMGRVAYSGIYQYPASTAGTSYRAALQTTVDGQGTLWENQQATGTGYSGAAWPQANILRYLMLNYYDNYTFPNKPYSPTVSNTLTSPTGLLTASKTAVLLPDGTYGAMLWMVNFYDDHSRVAQTDKQHYRGGEAIVNTNNYDETNYFYNFSDQVTGTVRHHYVAGSQSMAVSTNYQYDHMGRKTRISEAISIGTNPAPVPTIIAQLDYNEIGQLKTKHLHSTNSGDGFLQDVDYTYNERGWLSQINNPAVAASATELFSLKLNYNVPQFGATAQFNGNIAEQQYNAGISGNQHVNYSYDNLNRLKAGISTIGFSETISSYDNQGNIQGLTRTTAPNAVTLAYTYTGNQLQTVTNASTAFRSYAYDLNGNSTSDGQGNTITYNMINLPRNIAAKNLSYTYSATGEKLRKNSNGAITEYINGIQYKPDGTIDFVQTEEGRANRSGTNYVYEYTLKDHLGNNRVTFDQTSGKVGEDDYYPFGLNAKRLTNAGNKYLYNNKELQEELGQYDYGARFYDPVVARWLTIDPLAEKYGNTSPYGYVANNPISAYDGDGRKIIYVNGYFSRLLNLVGMAPGSAKEGYWKFFDPSFIASSRQFMGATNNELNEFIDGSSLWGGDQSGGDRYEIGRQYAIEHYYDLIKGMKEGETFKFVSHSEGGAFAAGMASYLMQRGQTVQSMLYMSPDEADEFKSPIGTFSMQAHFDKDPVAPLMRLDGVNVFMQFSTLDGQSVGRLEAHGSSPTSSTIKKMQGIINQLGPWVNKIMIKGKWSVTETKNDVSFKRIDEEDKDKEDKDK
jgi:RHS repeat-associated protein